MDFARNIFSD